MVHNKAFLIALLTIASYTYTLEESEKTEAIILVHGTVKPVELSFANLIKIMRNNIDNSIYVQTAALVRSDPFFYQGQAIQELGLKRIDEHSLSKGSSCLARLYEEQYKFLKNKTQRHYYTFGWDGLLNTRKRYEAAKIFHRDLTAEVKKLRSEGLNPKIKVVAYSHGANVALNLAAVQDDDPALKENLFHIDELIMLGAPILRSTDYLVSHPIFKKVFNLYSTEDSIQTMDMFSTRELFSNQRFSNRSKFKVPQKVTQVRLRTVRKIKGLDKLKEMPEHPYQVLSKRKIKLSHRDSGHTELWSFKWGAYWYRKNYPLAPLPTATLVPSILHALETYAPERRNITFDYSRTQAGALLIPRLKRAKKAVPILDIPTTENLYKIAKTYIPKDFSLDLQHERMEEILQKVRDTMKSKRRPRGSRLLISYFNKQWSKVNPQSKKLAHVHLLSPKF
jgi:hypothetical protein